MKNVKGMIGLFVLFTLIAGALSCADIPAEPQSDSSTHADISAEPQAANPDQQYPDTKIVAEGYTKRYGVSIDEAYHRLELQESISDSNLESQLVGNEAATFAGLWIQHEPQYKIVVAFTHDGEKTITKYSDYIPAKIAPYLEVRTVEKTLAELSDDQQALMSSLRKLGIPADSRVDVFNNCVSIDITSENEAKYKSVEQSGGLKIPERLKINIVKGLMVVN